MMIEITQKIVKRIFIPDDMEDEALDMVTQYGDSNTSLPKEFLGKWCCLWDNVEESADNLSPEQNGGFSTVVVLDDNYEIIWQNGK